VIVAGLCACMAGQRVAFLLREVIELAEEVLQLPDAGPYGAAHQQRVGQSCMTCCGNACDLARLTGIDLVEAAADKRQFNKRRAWSDADP
jgi:hypothetical protein